MLAKSNIELTFHLAPFLYVITISYFSLISCNMTSWIHFAYNLQVKQRIVFFVAIWRCIFKCAIKTEGYIIGLCISLWWAMQHYFILQWSETRLHCLMKSLTSWQKRAYRSVYICHLFLVLAQDSNYIGLHDRVRISSNILFFFCLMSIFKQFIVC